MLNNEKIDSDQVLVGMADSTTPFVHVRANNNNYVEMVGRDSGSGNFFEVVAGGNTVFAVDESGAFGLKNNGDYSIGDDGIKNTGVTGSSINPPKALRFFDGSDNLIGVYGATENTLRMAWGVAPIT